MRFALLCALVAFAVAPARAQYPVPADTVTAIAEPAPDEEANHAPDPNRVPYETDTSLGERALALPATLWNGVAYAVRSAVLWAEYSGTIARLQARYTGPEPPPYGFTPTVGFGGRDGFTAGGSVFYNDVFGTGRHGRVGGSYGFEAPETYRVFGRFHDRALFGSTVSMGLDASYESDGDERFFEPGNDTPEEDQLTYGLRRSRAEAAFLVPLFGPFSLDLSADLKRIDVRRGDVPFPIGIAGLGQADLASAGGDVVFDFSRAAGLTTQRTYAGSVLLLGYRYGDDLSTPATSDRPFGYHRLHAEWRQFVPVPFLAFNRRLAFRTRLVKTHPPDGHVVPFYELATLGGPNDLRGYANDRFRDEGALLVTLEYRYPVFDILDAVVFYDGGQVFHRYKDLNPADFHHDVGAGLRVYGRRSVAGRLEVAYSPEGVRLLARIGTTF